MMLAALGWLAACASAGPAPPDPQVAVSLANAGAAPMHCRVMFGHWVERDLGVLAPGARVAFDVRQQRTDGALYVMRADGQRRMMIETILCGIDADWSATVGQVDLAPARSGRPRRIVAACAAPDEAGRIACPPARLEP